MGLWNSDEDRWIMWEITCLWRIRGGNKMTRYGEILVNDLGAGNRLDRDDDSLYVLVKGFKTSPRVQSLCWNKAFNPRNITYIPVVERLVPPRS